MMDGKILDSNQNSDYILTENYRQDDDTISVNCVNIQWIDTLFHSSIYIFPKIFQRNDKENKIYSS